MSQFSNAPNHRPRWLLWLQVDLPRGANESYAGCGTHSFIGGPYEEATTRPSRVLDRHRRSGDNSSTQCCAGCGRVVVCVLRRAVHRRRRMHWKRRLQLLQIVAADDR